MQRNNWLLSASLMVGCHKLVLLMQPLACLLTRLTILIRTIASALWLHKSLKGATGAEGD